MNRLCMAADRRFFSPGGEGEPAPAPGVVGAKPGANVTATDGNGNLDAVLRIPVQVQVILGTVTMPVSRVAKLGHGSVIPLDRRIGEPVDVVVNNRVVARGEVVVLDEDNSRFGISLTEITGSTPPDKSA